MRIRKDLLTAPDWSTPHPNPSTYGVLRTNVLSSFPAWVGVQCLGFRVQWSSWCGQNNGVLVKTYESMRIRKDLLTAPDW